MEKILSLLGFAKKAGKLVTGTNAVLRSILYGDAYLVIIADDAGSSVKDKFKRICDENDVKLYILGNSKDLERATGEENKVIYSVTEAGFSNKLGQLIESLEK
jgi:ribosomal protein L7Ae-like RNA K-turn-binding protein